MNFVKSKTDYLVLFLLISIPLFFGMGQEIVALDSMHDDYYFLLRSVDFNLQGNYLAGIKEVLYPYFIRFSSLFGLGLRNFEVICYGLALFCLWRQLVSLINSRLGSLIMIMPLALFSYQSEVFNRSTYDVLQLILLPLTFASSIFIYLKRANWKSVLLAGGVVVLQVLTRAEGFLFAFPAIIAVIFVMLDHSAKTWMTLKVSIKEYLIKIVIMVSFVLLGQQVASFLNWSQCGFWAPTIITSSGFQRSLSALMAIQPLEAGKMYRVPVSKFALEQGYRVSPELLKAKAFFDNNIDGKGRSHRGPLYHIPDGNLGGAVFQWVLLDAGAYVENGKADKMLVYFNKVADEIEQGFKSGALKRRFVLSTAFGPDFRLFSQEMGESLCKVGAYFLNLTKPPLVKTTNESTDQKYAEGFNKIALRRTSLIGTTNEEMLLTMNWLTNGGAKVVVLDKEASERGIKLAVKYRSGKSGKSTVSLWMWDLLIRSRGEWRGALIVTEPGQRTVSIPLKNLRSLSPRGFYKVNGVVCYLSNLKKNSALPDNPVTVGISNAVYYMMRYLILLSLVIILMVFILRKNVILKQIDLRPFLLVLCLAVSVALPRLLLLSSIDAYMFSGIETRYLAAGVFSMWFLALFSVVYVGRGIGHYQRVNVA